MAACFGSEPKSVDDGPNTHDAHSLPCAETSAGLPADARSCSFGEIFVDSYKYDAIAV
jgi:hypothetical protein